MTPTAPAGPHRVPHADVAVVGGGPVGLAAAVLARRSGMTVVVLEPRQAPVDKACGEGVMPGGVAALRALGVLPAGRPLAGIRYLAAGCSAEAAFRDGTGLGVRRTVLHAALLEEANRAGADLRGLTVDGLRQDGDGVTLEGHEPGRSRRHEVHARHVLAADGLHSTVRRRLGLQARPHGPVRYGQRRHVAAPPWTDHVEVHWAPHAEAYVTPVAADTVGVAVLSAARVPFPDLLAGFPTLTDRLTGAEPVSAVRGAGPLRQRTRARVAGRTLLVGDAAGYVDALTGEGIALGLAQAAAAVAALDVGRPGNYEGEWARIGRRYGVLTHALVEGTRPRWARRAVVPTAAALPRVFSAAVHQLGRSP